MNDDFERIWKDLVVQLLGARPVERRGSKTLELLNVSRTWYARTAFLGNAERNISTAFAKAEAKAILTGSNSVAPLEKYAPSIGRFSDNGKVFTGAYGPHWIAQREYVLEALRKDLYTRQAVLTIWQPRPSNSVDVPCTVSWQFMFVDGRLDMFICMRSSDVWLGLPYDAFTWSVILHSIATELQLESGKVHYHATTCHLYARNIPAADRVAESFIENHRWIPYFATAEDLLSWLG